MLQPVIVSRILFFVVTLKPDGRLPIPQAKATHTLQKYKSLLIIGHFSGFYCQKCSNCREIS